MKLEEIQRIPSQLTKGFAFNSFDMDHGTDTGETAENIPIWIFHAKINSNIKLYALKNNNKIITSVVAEPYKNFTIIGRAWTLPKYRNKGYLTALYANLVRKLGLKLLSDRDQSPETIAVWKKLNAKVLYVPTMKILDRTKVSDDELYSDNNETDTYRLILEDVFVLPRVGKKILKDYINYTHSENRRKFI